MSLAKTQISRGGASKLKSVAIVPYIPSYWTVSKSKVERQGNLLLVALDVVYSTAASNINDIDIYLTGQNEKIISTSKMVMAMSSATLVSCYTWANQRLRVNDPTVGKEYFFNFVLYLDSAN